MMTASGAILALALLAPQEAVEELKEIHKLMEGAERALEGASLGKAAAEQEEILKMLGDLAKDPAELQGKALEMIDKLLKRGEKDQKETIERITELIKKAKQQGQGQGQPQPGEPQPQPGQPQSGSAPQPSGPAQSPYNPNRTDPPSKFRSIADRHGEWGNLPAKEREEIFHQRRAIDRFPPEFRSMLQQYWKEIMDREVQR
jgi:hypothetical protein